MVKYRVLRWRNFDKWKKVHEMNFGKHKPWKIKKTI